jgi:hypothetical protein
VRLNTDDRRCKYVRPRPGYASALLPTEPESTRLNSPLNYWGLEVNQLRAMVTPALASPRPTLVTSNDDCIAMFLHDGRSSNAKFQH